MLSHISRARTTQIRHFILSLFEQDDQGQMGGTKSGLLSNDKNKIVDVHCLACRIKGGVFAACKGVDGRCRRAGDAEWGPRKLGTIFDWRKDGDLSVVVRDAVMGSNGRYGGQVIFWLKSTGDYLWLPVITPYYREFPRIPADYWVLQSNERFLPLFWVILI